MAVAFFVSAVGSGRLLRRAGLAPPLRCGLQLEVKVHKAPHHSNKQIYNINNLQTCSQSRMAAAAQEAASEVEPAEFGRSADEEIVDLTCESPVVDLTYNDAVVFVEQSRQRQNQEFGSQSFSDSHILCSDDDDSECRESDVLVTKVVQKVNELIATGQYGRLFAVVHFASRQWKVTSEDLILIENHIPAECGDRIRIEKVLLVGADNFTLLGKPVLGKDLVRVEATVIEKTESWPRINMRFRPKCHFQRKRIIIQPQTVLRINNIEIAPALS
ncbi:hypothetical protein JD844_022035 [Phrynosoma platyrhinos]|uniref:Large ribosomal subunit protein bL21m n=1 Tax=Phrynosoma platyrhinos TaxID=52577 RepID=A0ABQ7SUU6_PHRPL|nr:hypothetical protein JD844_022035 [Phrynosoma platyrhinos]